MYLAHPKDTFSFDAEDFIKQNEEILKELKNQSIQVIPGSFRDQKIIEQRSAIITFAVWHNFTSLSEIPTDFKVEEDDDSAVVMAMYSSFMFWLTLECMRDNNMVEKVGEKYRNTPFLEGVQQRKKKVFGKKRVR